MLKAKKIMKFKLKKMSRLKIVLEILLMVKQPTQQRRTISLLNQIKGKLLRILLAKKTINNKLQQ